jgi:DNA-binding transcriptional regulator YdaS (Cro superfamily)
MGPPKKINWKLKAQIADFYGTQADFAHFVGVDSSYVSAIIRFRKKLPESSVEQWAKALEMFPQELRDTFGT